MKKLFFKILFDKRPLFSDCLFHDLFKEDDEEKEDIENRKKRKEGKK